MKAFRIYVLRKYLAQEQMDMIMYNLWYYDYQSQFKVLDNWYNKRKPKYPEEFLKDRAVPYPINIDKMEYHEKVGLKRAIESQNG